MSHYRKNILSVLLTTECNLDCAYCILGARHRDKVEIGTDFARAGVDYFFDTTTSRWIRFYATGEPTMAFEKMVGITEYAREKAGSALTVELQTNGTFAFRPEVRRWASKNVDLTYISFDGLPEIQDKYRRTRGGRATASRVLENIRYLLDRSRFVAIRATVTSDLLHRQKEMIDFLGEMGVRYIFSKNVLPSVEARIVVPESDLMEYARTYVEAFKYARSKDIYYGNCYMCGFDEKSICYCRQAIPAPHLTPDGYVSSCDRACSGETSMPGLLYGKFDPESREILIDEEKVARIRARNLYNLEQCRDCEVGPYCCGSCTGTAYQKTGDLYGIVGEYCDAIRYMHREIGWNSGFFPCFHP
jgi:radical SAM protein with 4Fe4S-binding SPASM domain